MKFYFATFAIYFHHILEGFWTPSDNKMENDSKKNNFLLEVDKRIILSFIKLFYEFNLAELD